MNRKQTWALWEKAQASSEPAAVWNAWANGLLQEKRELEESGKWERVKRGWEQEARVEFLDRSFDDDTDFSDFILPGRSLFSRVLFRDGTEFSRTDFLGSATFSKSRFEGEITQFDGASFKGETWFTETLFERDVNFINTTFDKDVRFYETIFNGFTHFDQSKFKGDALFGGGSFFKGEASFYRASWEKMAYFRRVFFVENKALYTPFKTSFDHAVFKEAAIFDGAVFGKVSFYGALVDRAFSLSGARFLSVPNFIQASFKEPPRLDDMVVLPLLSKGEREKRLEKIREEIKSREEKRQKSLSAARDAEDTREEESAENPAPVPAAPEADSTEKTPDYDDEAKYRALRRVAIVAHDHEKEMDFFAGEILARRAKPEWWKNPMMWVSYPYQWFSDFGRSMFLPLAWTFAVWMVFAAGYGFGGSIGAECGPASSALELSFRRMFFAFDRGGQRMEEIYQCLGGPFVYTEILQSLFSALLIFLFALSVRNHFRIK